MAPRGPLRAHKKSRSGCTTCRARRIKCDEARPACNNCSKRSLLCAYHGKPPAGTGRIPIAKQSSAPAQSAESILVQPYYHKLAPPPGHCLPPSADLDLVHLSLLHQYSTSTYDTFCAHPPGLKVWREQVPRMAFSYPEVLHAVFASSALHLAFLNPAECSRYQLMAADHCQKASVLLRQTLASGYGGLEVGGASFVASCLIALCVFADPSMRTHEWPRAMTWIPYVRGVRTVLRTYHGPLVESKFGPVLRIEWQPDSDELSMSSRKSVPELPKDLDALHLTEPDIREAEIYAVAIQKLRESWEVSKNPEFRLQGVFMWPVNVSDEYLELLRMKRPRALALLAVYYCAMFPHLEGRWWNRLTALEDLKNIKDMFRDQDDETWKSLLEDAGQLWTRDVE